MRQNAEQTEEMIFPTGTIWIDRRTEIDGRRGYQMLRRFQDIVFSLLALVVLFPFLVLLALIVWVDSPGASPIFTQQRVGRDGRLFDFYKFRSMVPNAEKIREELLHKNEMDGPVFKIKDDPRITRVGRILRKSGLDELPQLVNILRGDMSIVGPRPALPKEVEHYNDYIRQRLLVPAGLTCYWQIMPNRNELSFMEWMELDLRYIKERSFLTDWSIIFKTVHSVITMQGR